MLDMIMDALLDTVKLLPYLLVTFLVLEFIEHKLSHKNEKLLSNNRKFGEMYVKKEPFKKLAEGVETAKALKLLGEKYNVDLPITNAVCSILNDNKDPMEVFLSLFSRSTRKEF